MSSKDWSSTTSSCWDYHIQLIFLKMEFCLDVLPACVYVNPGPHACWANALVSGPHHFWFLSKVYLAMKWVAGALLRSFGGSWSSRHQRGQVPWGLQLEGSCSGFLESARTVLMFSNVEDFTNTSDLQYTSYVRTQTYVFFHPFPIAPDTKDKHQPGVLRHGILWPRGLQQLDCVCPLDWGHSVAL